MEEKQVTLDNGETIFYRERSGGEVPVILIHGNMSSSKHWETLMHSLAPKYKLFAPDLRGFGQSTYYTKIQSVNDFAYDLKQFSEKLGLKKFSLIGWSLGGAVVMRFTLDYPELVEKLVLLASVSTRGYPIFSMDEDGTFNFKKRLKSLSEIETDYRTKWMQHLYDTNNREELKKFLKSFIYNVNEPDEKIYEAALEAMIQQRNLAEANHTINSFNISNHFNGTFEGTDEAKEIHVPVLNIYGDKDRTVTKRMIEEIKNDLSHCVTTVELKNCGHAPEIDDLPKLTREIENFLQ